MKTFRVRYLKLREKSATDFEYTLEREGIPCSSAGLAGNVLYNELFMCISIYQLAGDRESIQSGSKHKSVGRDLAAR